MYEIVQGTLHSENLWRTDGMIKPNARIFLRAHQTLEYFYVLSCYHDAGSRNRTDVDKVLENWIWRIPLNEYNGINIWIFLHSVFETATSEWNLNRNRHCGKSCGVLTVGLLV